jgi:hypothetical protein
MEETKDSAGEWLLVWHDLARSSVRNRARGRHAGPSLKAASAESRERVIKAGELNAFFTCPLCSGYFREPVVMTGCCFSIYCKDCLVKAVRKQVRCPNMEGCDR